MKVPHLSEKLVVFTHFESRAPSKEPVSGSKVKFSVKCGILCQKKVSFFTKYGNWRVCHMTQVFTVFERLAPSSEDL